MFVFQVAGEKRWLIHEPVLDHPLRDQPWTGRSAAVAARASEEPVIDTVLPRHALYYACLGDPFDGKEAARIGMINYAVPPKKLEDAVTELAEKLMKKSPAVLRATKQAIRHCRTMDVAQSYEYLAAKGQAIKTADKEDSYNTGLRQFLDEKSYKPTFEPFKLGTLLTDQRSGGAKK